MDKQVLQYCLKDYNAWLLQQEQLDSRFSQGKLTKWEYVYAGMELLVQHMPTKDSDYKSLQYK